MLSVKTTCRKNYFLSKFCTIFKDINKIIFKHIFKAQIGISFKKPNKMFKLFLLELAILNCFLMHSRTLLSQPSAYSRLFPICGCNCRFGRISSSHKKSYDVTTFISKTGSAPKWQEFLFCLMERVFFPSYSYKHRRKLFRV